MNNVILYGDKCPKNLILALGYFDAVHKGHQKVLKKAVSVASEKGCTPSSLIFVGGKTKKDVFTLTERLRKIFLTGIKTVIVKELSKDFMALTKLEFLEELSSLYDVKGVVSGSDFTFGKNAEGSVATLKEFFGVENVFTENLEEEKGEKISSTSIKNALTRGDVLTANTMLGGNYFICGEVIRGKGLGRDLGFPTANILLDNNKHPINSGVYVTFTVIDGVVYPAITNVGAQPTVNGNDTVIETYIDGFFGDLYGKSLTVYFVERLRDIKKFNSIKELKEQLEKDLRSIR